MKTKLLKDRDNAAMFASVSHLFTYGAIEMGKGYSSGVTNETC